MVCEGCAEKIGEALRPLAGVREVRPKVAQKQVYVRYEPARVQEEDLRNALAGAGFLTAGAKHRYQAKDRLLAFLNRP
jgi:copper chaperone CopZ